MSMFASMRRLEVFHTIVDLGGFAAAATALGISQPSVTAHIKALEKQVGHPLFRRLPGRGARLTEAGVTVHAYAMEMLKRSEEVNAALQQLGQHGAPSLTIAIHRELSQSAFAEHIAEFIKTHPEIKLVMRSTTNDDVIARLQAGTVDVGIFLALGQVASVSSEVLGSERVAFLCSPKHPAAQHAKAGPREMARHGLIFGLEGSHYAALVATLLRRLGVQSHKVAIEVQDAAAALQFAKQGVGICCQLENLVQEPLERGELINLSAAWRPISMEVRWAGPADRPPSALALSLVDHLRRRRTFGRSPAGAQASLTT